MLRNITHTRRTVVLATSVVFCGVLFLGGVSVNFAQSGFGMSKGLPQHHQAPDFHLQTIDGKAVSKSSLNGQPTLMMFWAPWCHVCQVELPNIHDFHEAEAVKPHGLQVLSVGFADAKENVVGYIHGHSDVFTFLSAYDVDNIVASDFKIRATPTFVLLDADGFVRLVHPGAGVLHNPKLLSFVEDLVS
jgi:thiol-disulfide isomerase/thioredoxin